MKSRRVLVLHSDIAPDAPPDELDTLYQADAIVDALKATGHAPSRGIFVEDEDALRRLLDAHAADAIFNLVESIDGSGVLAARVPRLFERIGIPYTGAGSDELELTGDKSRAKSLIREASLPTPDWSEPPSWIGLSDGIRYIVKSSLEDASLGLDDASVVDSADGVRERAMLCTEKFGGRWFAEAYVEGREFNVAVLETNAKPHVLPLAEMTFQEWQRGRPRIVGYKAKWDDDSFESTRTVRAFGVEDAEQGLAAELRDLAIRTWNVLGLSGYVRIDFRVDTGGRPTILEVNPNPCLSPDAGFAAAAERAGISYPKLIEQILAASLE